MNLHLGMTLSWIGNIRGVNRLGLHQNLNLIWCSPDLVSVNTVERDRLREQDAIECRLTLVGLVRHQLCSYEFQLVFSIQLFPHIVLFFDQDGISALLRVSIRGSRRKAFLSLNGLYSLSYMYI